MTKMTGYVLRAVYAGERDGWSWTERTVSAHAQSDETTHAPKAVVVSVPDGWTLHETNSGTVELFDAEGRGYECHVDAAGRLWYAGAGGVGQLAYEK